MVPQYISWSFSRSAAALAYEIQRYICRTTMTYWSAGQLCLFQYLDNLDLGERTKRDMIIEFDWRCLF